MAYYKLCVCGNRITYTRKGGAPVKCDRCQRFIQDFREFDEDAAAEEEIQEEPVCERSERSLCFSLRPLNGDDEFVIPACGGIVGREGLGAQILEKDLAVGRKHMRVSYRSGLGLVIEDMSRYGTYLNGKQLTKGVPTFAQDGDVIKLCDYEVQIVRHEGIK